MVESQEPKRLKFIELGLFLALVVLGGLVGWPLVYQKIKPGLKVDGMIEAQDLKIRTKTSGLFFHLQPTSEFQSGQWVRDNQMFAITNAAGDFIEFDIPIAKSGPHNLEVYMTKASDYGIVQFLVDKKKWGDPIDLWSNEGVVNTGKISLGQKELEAGVHVLRIEVVGKNPSNQSPHFFFGIDGLSIQKI